MQYFGVKNFEKFQHYKSGKKSEKPTWIKLYTSVLHDYAFNSLSTHEQAVLMKLWLLAGTANNHLALDINYISRAIQIKRVRLDNLFNLGFLVMKDVAKENSSQSLALEENIKIEYKEENINKEEKIRKDKTLNNRSKMQKTHFDLVWSLYPEKIGKVKAERHFFAQVKTEDDLSDFQKAIENYKQYIGKIRNNGHPDRRYQHGSTFFNGYWRDWVNPEVEEPASQKSEEDARHEAKMKAIEERAFRKAGLPCP